MENEETTNLIQFADMAYKRWRDITCGPSDSSPESLAALAYAACQATLQLARIADALQAIAQSPRSEKEQ